MQMVISNHRLFIESDSKWLWRRSLDS